MHLNNYILIPFIFHGSLKRHFKKYTFWCKDKEMQPQKICKTVHQYSKHPIPAEDMDRLMEIAEDCRSVKNYVFQRYGGIGSLSKLHPGYTIQNEMTESGLRQRLGMPSVYFYLAMFDALADIRSQWTMTKSKIMKLVGANENLTPDEKHYIRFALNVGNVFEAILNRKPVQNLPKDIQRRYEQLAAEVDEEKLRRYLCRQARKYKNSLHAEAAQGFSISERAYRYADGGIHISTKTPRRRIFVPLTDANQYDRQLYIRLHPEESRLEIKVPVDVKVRRHKDYTNTVGIAVGVNTMLTTDAGNAYGEELGKLHYQYANWVRVQTGRYNRNKSSNPGRVKYRRTKNRHEERIHSYINQELNRFLREEKPAVVYMVKLPRPGAQVGNKRGNHYLSMWQRGYIRRRLVQKCMENSVEVVEVLGKDISRQCSICGHVGAAERDGKAHMPEAETSGGGGKTPACGGAARFVCRACGHSADAKVNTARNVKRRGEAGLVVR